MVCRLEGSGEFARARLGRAFGWLTSAVMLVSCGGGGGNGGALPGAQPSQASVSGSNSQSANPEIDPAGHATPEELQPTGPGVFPTFSFKFGPGHGLFDATAASKVLTALNSPDLRDYIYWSQTAFSTQAVYVKKTPTTAYTYVIGTDSIAAARNGYLTMGVFSGELPILFGKPVGDTAVYDFQSFTPSTNAEQLLADLNASGAQGYCRAVGPLDTRGSLFLVKRVEPSPANCVYKVDDLPVGSMTEQGGLEQANRLGAQGYSQFAVIGHQYWVRDTTQQIRYSYEMVAAPTNADELLAQLNEHGARGFEVHRQSATTYIYRRTLDCTRVRLC